VGSGTHGNQLNAVAVVSANDVWAVGFSPHPSGTPLYIRQTLIEHWDGRSWSIIPSPSPGTYNGNILTAVVAIAANDVWAVGDNGQTQHWNGADWSRVAAPYPGLGGRFNSVAAASASDVWAVGSYTDGNQWLTWIDRYTVP
jgi:hypothetical protein